MANTIRPRSPPLETVGPTRPVRPRPRRRGPARRLARCLALLAVALAAATTSAADPGATDTILAWNAVALRTTAAAPFDPPLEGRNLAIVHAAMFDAANSVRGHFHPFLTASGPAAPASEEGAAAAAAHRALTRLYPAQQAALDEAWRATLANLPPGPLREAAVAAGRDAADRMLAVRAGDGAAAAQAAAWTGGRGSGDWVPTPPAFRPPLDPGWGRVRPFLLTDGAALRPGPPPAPGSAAYQRDLAEVRRLGATASEARTAAQTDLARLWTVTGAQVWNPVARQAIAARGLGPVEAARVLALLNLAGADVFIATWEAKFHYGQWRPVTALRAAGDPDWTPLIATPPFPDYPAGHPAYAGAAAVVLTALLGEAPAVPLRVTSAGAPGTVLTYATFDAIAADVVEARIVGGVHWRASCDAGLALGVRLGRLALERHLRPAGAEARAAGGR